MEVICLPLGAYQTNCYLAWGEDSPGCIVIDPGFTPEAVLQKARELGNELYEKFLAICEELGYPPQHGEFGADMQVESVNDGPVTLILDTDQLMDTPRR